jgi:hypothetical protein
MATTRRHGNRAAFWGSINASTLALTPATVNANDPSAVVGVGRAADQVTIFVDAGGAFTAKVQVAHSSPATGDTTEGISWDYDSLGFTTNTLGNTNWFDLFYMSGDSAGGGVPVVLKLAGAGRQAVMIPDWVDGYIRLVCTVGASVAVVAGYEAVGT